MARWLIRLEPRRANGLAVLGLAVATAAVLAGCAQDDPVREEWRIETVAGSGERGPKGFVPKGYRDGPANQAQFFQPVGLAVDSEGNIFVSEAGNHRIRKISPAGIVTTVAGTGEPGFRDGPADAAQFFSPGNLRFDDKGNLYIADVVNHRIRVLSPDGIVSTVAGTNLPACRKDTNQQPGRDCASSPEQGGFRDGPASEALFDGPAQIVLDAGGNLYVADKGNNRIRKVSVDGQVTTIAGNGDPSGSDGPALQVGVGEPVGLAIAPDGTIYFTQHYGPSFRKLTLDGRVETIAGVPTIAPSDEFVDGPTSSARFASPSSIAMSLDGTIYMGDWGNNRVRRYDPSTGRIDTIAGGAPGFQDGPALGEVMSGIGGLVVLADGSLLVADLNNSRIRRMFEARP